MVVSIYKQYNQLSDVTTEDQLIIEFVSGQPLTSVPIDDINSFLNELYLFHSEAEEELWTSLF
jgi:hypothetical protein